MEGLISIPEDAVCITSEMTPDLPFQIGEAQASAKASKISADSSVRLLEVQDVALRYKALQLKRELAVPKESLHAQLSRTECTVPIVQEDPADNACCNWEVSIVREDGVHPADDIGLERDEVPLRLGSAKNH